MFVVLFCILNIFFVMFKVGADDPSAAANDPGAAAKDPGAAANEPGAAAKDPGAAANEPGAAAKDPGAAAKDPGAAAKDPGAAAKDPGAAANEPGPAANGPDAAAKNPIIFANKVMPDLKYAKGLVCYQCFSNGSEVTPSCDQSFFKLVRPEERVDLLFQCPNYQGDFCFKKVVKLGKKVNTTRGCARKKDSNDKKMKVGCMRSNQGKVSTQLCLCKKDTCNSASILQNVYKCFGICLAIILVNIQTTF